LSAQVVDLGVHPSQEQFSGCCRDAGALKLQDLLTLFSDLGAYVLDFGAYVV